MSLFAPPHIPTLFHPHQPLNHVTNRKRQSLKKAMVIECMPTPLPDFHVDDRLVAELQQRCLRDDTADLMIEELEQPRATCLGNV